MDDSKEMILSNKIKRKDKGSQENDQVFRKLTRSSCNQERLTGGWNERLNRDGNELGKNEEMRELDS